MTGSWLHTSQTSHGSLELDAEGKIPRIVHACCKNEWWSIGKAALDILKPSKPSNYGHAGRIMETELGVSLNIDTGYYYKKNSNTPISKLGIYS